MAGAEVEVSKEFGMILGGVYARGVAVTRMEDSQAWVL